MQRSRNGRKAELVRSALAYYARITGIEGADAESLLVDFLTDARHFCDEEGVDFGRSSRTAHSHYVEEHGDDAKEESAIRPLWRLFDGSAFGMAEQYIAKHEGAANTSAEETAYPGKFGRIVFIIRESTAARNKFTDNALLLLKAAQDGYLD